MVWGTAQWGRCVLQQGRGGCDWSDDGNSPPFPNSGLQTHLLFHTELDRKEKSDKEKGWGGIQTKRVRLKNLPAPTWPEKGNASERLRDSSGPHLNSSSWTLIYRWSLSDTLEKGSGDPLSSAERTMGHKGPDLLGRSWGMPSSCPLLSADASGSKNDWWCVRESW